MCFIRQRLSQCFGDCEQASARRTREWVGPTTVVPLHPTVASLHSQKFRLRTTTRDCYITSAAITTSSFKSTYTSGSAIMKLLKSQIEQKTGAGFVTLLPEEPEDMVSAPQTDCAAGEFQSARRHYVNFCSGTLTT